LAHIDFTPLYYKLQEKIRSEIRGGKLKPGDCLPSEAALSEEYGISRITVRNALQKLVYDGLIHRNKGKGTFVSEPKVEQRLYMYHSFGDALKSKGIQPRLVLLNYVQVEADSRVREKLRLRKDAVVYRLERQRFAGDQLVGLEIRYFPFELGKKLKKEDIMGKDMYTILHEVTGQPVKNLVNTVTCILADIEVAKKIKYRVGSPLLVLDQVFFLSKGKPMLYGTIIYRADRYQVSFELREVNFRV
jgi:GntR family transcriptional regulator